MLSGCACCHSSSCSSSASSCSHSSGSSGKFIFPGISAFSAASSISFFACFTSFNDSPPSLYFSSSSICLSSAIPLISYAAEKVRRPSFSSAENSGIKCLLILSICAIFVPVVFMIEAITSRRRPLSSLYP